MSHFWAIAWILPGAIGKGITTAEIHVIKIALLRLLAKLKIHVGILLLASKGHKLPSPAK
jgi:hypothetical protein